MISRLSPTAKYQGQFSSFPSVDKSCFVWLNFPRSMWCKMVYFWPHKYVSPISTVVAEIYKTQCAKKLPTPSPLLVSLWERIVMKTAETWAGKCDIHLQVGEGTCWQRDKSHAAVTFRYYHPPAPSERVVSYKSITCWYEKRVHISVGCVASIRE